MKKQYRTVKEEALRVRELRRLARKFLLREAP